MCEQVELMPRPIRPTLSVVLRAAPRLTPALGATTFCILTSAPCRARRPSAAPLPRVHRFPLPVRARWGLAGVPGRLAPVGRAIETWQDGALRLRDDGGKRQRRAPLGRLEEETTGTRDLYESLGTHL
jgi:hypothetical protein